MQRLAIATLSLMAAFAPGAASAQRPPGGGAASCAAPSRAYPNSGSRAWRRHNQVQSDSLWLIADMRRRYPERLAAAYVAGAEDAARLRLVFRLTGRDPVPPMRLAGRARQVPVTVQYGAPHSLREVERIRRRVHDRVLALLPTLQGVGYDEQAGAIHLDVYAPDAAARRAVLARCAALRALYAMPVRIEASEARIVER